MACAVSEAALIVPPTVVLTTGLTSIVAREAPTENVPALTPYAVAVDLGVAEARILISSAVTLDVVMAADTVGEILTFVTEPPAATEITPTATVAEPVMLLAVDVLLALTLRSPDSTTVEPLMNARVVVLTIF
tara:strand:- start:16 stop:414 length:399 start_codon:yes stop_codon:yes gene_type:complete